jgi:hypothetical protein
MSPSKPCLQEVHADDYRLSWPIRPCQRPIRHFELFVSVSCMSSWGFNAGKALRQSKKATLSGSRWWAGFKAGTGSSHSQQRTRGLYFKR